jgi:Fic family protein
LLHGFFYAVNRVHNRRTFEEKSSRRRTHIWQRPDWPLWRFDGAALAAPLAEVHRAQGHLAGRMAELGLAQRDLATLQALTQEVTTTSAIEGEALNLEAVRSSVTRRLGVDIGEKQEELAPANRHVDGVVDMVLDATQHHAQPLTAERLFGWHAALFPTGYSGRVRIQVGGWRNDAAGPMQVVSGPVGREMVHFEAPPATALPAETAAFLRWFNAAQSLQPATPSSMPGWPTSGLSPCTRLTTATAASAAPWVTWPWPAQRARPRGSTA